MFTSRQVSVAAAVTVSVAFGFSSFLAATPARAMPTPARAAPPACTAPTELIGLAQVLPRVAQRLADGKALKIVALGSSSTEGIGASSPANSYPSRLQAELRARFPKLEVVVVNLGVGGEDAKEMLARLKQVAAENPDLVLWQVGTNAVLDELKLSGEAALIRAGLARLKATGADVVLMDLQFAPKVAGKSNAARMVQLLGAAAEADHISVFRRFAIMRHWRTTEHVPFSRFISADGLHLNDWSYGCIAKLLAGSIVEAATRAAPVVASRVATQDVGS